MSSNNKKGPIYDPGKCRCCGASKKCRLLNVEYEHVEKKEVYSDMFVECFGLVLSHLDGEETDRLICAMCVARLREANTFRRQVLQCEENLLKTHIHVHGDGTCGVAPMEIKMEVTIKEENEDEDMICCDDSNDVETVNTVATQAEVAEGTVNIQSAEVKTGDDRHKEQLLSRMLRTKERLKRMQRPRKPRRPQPEPSRDKFVDEDSLSFHNSVTLVENSYICPFQTSYSSYFCMYCKATFNDPAKLKEHNLKHDPKNFKNFFNGKKATYMDIERIDCRLCNKKITDLEVFKGHLTEKHGKKLNNIKDELLKFRLKNGSLSCTECNKKFVFFHALKRHMAEHFGSFVCDVCAAHYFDKKTLEVHFKNAHASEAKYTCHECGKMFKSKHTLFLHVSTVHKTEAAFQCSKCDVALFSNMERFRHMYEVHGESRTYPCESCGREYMNRKNLLEHNRTAHLRRGARAGTGRQARNEKSFHCDMCGKSYPRLHYLKLHIQAHNSAACT